MHGQAAEAYLKATHALPVNIKFLLEGQEEIGSPNLAEILEEHKDLLAADMALSADGGQINEKQVMYLTSAWCLCDCASQTVQKLHALHLAD